MWDQCSLIHEVYPSPSIHEICSKSVERIMRVAMSRGTADNVSVIVLALPNFQAFLSKPNPIPFSVSRNLVGDKPN